MSNVKIFYNHTKILLQWAVKPRQGKYPGNPFRVTGMDGYDHINIMGQPGLSVNNARNRINYGKVNKKKDRGSQTWQFLNYSGQEGELFRSPMMICNPSLGVSI